GRGHVGSRAVPGPDRTRGADRGGDRPGHPPGRPDALSREWPTTEVTNSPRVPIVGHACPRVRAPVRSPTAVSRRSNGGGLLISWCRRRAGKHQKCAGMALALPGRPYMVDVEATAP